MTNIFTYLSRLPRSRGFGVQSPTDYHFLRHVIRQKHPYYAYQTLARLTKGLGRREEKLLRFYLRLANYAQNRYPIVILASDNGNIRESHRQAFLKAGSKSVEFIQTTNLEQTLSLPEHGALHERQYLLVVENMEQHRQALRHNSVRIVFEMQHIAVAFCNVKRENREYKVLL